MDFEERRFAYLKTLSKEELKGIIKECMYDIEKYDQAREEKISSEELSELEIDYNHSMSRVRYLKKIGLFNEEKPNKKL